MSHEFDDLGSSTRKLSPVMVDINGDGSADMINASEVVPADNPKQKQFIVEPALLGPDNLYHPLKTVSSYITAFGTTKQWFESREASWGNFYQDNSPIPFAIGQLVTVRSKKNAPEPFRITSFVVGIDLVPKKGSDGRKTVEPRLTRDTKQHVIRQAYGGKNGKITQQASLEDLVWMVGQDQVLDMKHVVDKKSKPVTPSEKLLRPLFDQMQVHAKMPPMGRYQMAGMVTNAIKEQIAEWEKSAKDQKTLGLIKQDPLLWNQIRIALAKVAGINPESLTKP